MTVTLFLIIAFYRCCHLLPRHCHKLTASYSGISEGNHWSWFIEIFPIDLLLNLFHYICILSCSALALYSYFGAVCTVGVRNDWYAGKLLAFTSIQWHAAHLFYVLWVCFASGQLAMLSDKKLKLMLMCCHLHFRGKGHSRREVMFVLGISIISRLKEDIFARVAIFVTVIVIPCIILCILLTCLMFILCWVLKY